MSLPSHPFEFASLTACLPRWKEAQADHQVMQWLSDGYALQFSQSPQPCDIPNRTMAPPDLLFLQQQVKEYLLRDAIEPILPSQAFCVCPIFVVQGKKPRMIHDLRHLNQYLNAPRVKLESINQLAPLLRSGDWMVKTDVKSGYHHIWIREQDRRFLAFRLLGQLYRWKVLPFGLATAPFVFVKTIKVTLRVLRSLGLRCNLYMDDWLLVSQSQQELLQQQQLLWRVCHEMGWALSPDKSVTIPSQRLEYLGFILDTTEKPVLRIPPAKRQSLCHSIARLIFRPQQPTTKRTLSQVLGSCVHMTRAWLPSKLLLHEAYRLLNTAPYWESKIFLTTRVLQDLRWWFDSLHHFDGGQLLEPSPPDLTIDTDASPTGWGAVLYLKSGQQVQAAGHWTKTLSGCSNNVRELTAVHKALQSFVKLLPSNSSLRINSDNTTTVAYLNKFGGRFANLDNEARILFALAARHNWTLSAHHVPGILNVIPDQLSRRLDRSDWKLHPTLFQLAEHLWGHHTIDRFATAVNKQTRRFNSAMLQPGSEAVDALTQSWAHDNNWINPPWRLIPQVLSKLRRDRAVATLVVPVWPSQSWWPTLLQLVDLSAPPPIALPRVQGVFIPSLPTVDLLPEPWKCPNWRVALIRVSGRRPANSPATISSLQSWLDTPMLGLTALTVLPSSSSSWNETLARCRRLLSC